MTLSENTFPRLPQRVWGYGALWGPEIVRRDRRCLTFARNSLVILGNTFLQIDHDDRQTLADSDSGFLQVTSDSLGIRFLAQLPDSSFGRRTLDAIREGRLWGCSAGFSAG